MRLPRAFLCCSLADISRRCVHSFVHTTFVFEKGPFEQLSKSNLVLRRPYRAITTMSVLSQRSDDGILVLPNIIDGLNRHPVFVYGSLLSGLNNHHVMIQKNASFVSRGRTQESFYLTGLQSDLYPFLSRIPLVGGQSQSPITGELYTVATEVIAELDEFEGDEYMRTEIAVETLLSPEDGSTGYGSGPPREAVMAYVYLLVSADKIAAERPDLSSLSDNRHPLVPVAGGCWRSHLKEREQQKKG
jgi:gamma-glutamylcyclotransferase (GGCT)/AIG2-like uncharacterized protein YtfP